MVCLSGALPGAAVVPSARGLPCERFTAALTSRISCITRGRGGWLDLPRGGLAPPILCQLPGALREGSFATEMGRRRNVRFVCDSDRTRNVRDWRHKAIG